VSAYYSISQAGEDYNQICGTKQIPLRGGVARRAGVVVRSTIAERTFLVREMELQYTKENESPPTSRQGGLCHSLAVNLQLLTASLEFAE